MNLNNLIQKVIEIDFIKNNDKELKLCIIFTFFKMLATILIAEYLFDLSILISSIIYLFFCIFSIIVEHYLLKSNNIFSKVSFKNKTKHLKLTEEEKNIINEYTFSYDFNLYYNDHNSLLNYLIEKNISEIDYNNLEEFLIILKKNNLYKKYSNQICDKITNHTNLMQIAYPEDDYSENFQFSKEELLFSKFLNKNQDIKPLILEKLYINCSIQELKENKNFLNQLSIENISKKLLDSYTLKEIIHSFFHYSDLNNTFFKIEILDIINLLNEENKILIKKLFIEKVLEEKDKSLIEYCYAEFFKSSFNLNLKNKNELYDLKSQFSEEQLVFNNNLKIIHI